MQIEFLPGEAWWGGAVCGGVDQPYTAASRCTAQLEQNPTPNQCMPLLLSDRGRWLWADGGFTARFEGGRILCPEGVELGEAAEPTLRGAYLAAMGRHFPPQGAPDRRFFTAPVYNTWIELTFNQTQAGVLAYARGILENGFAPGVLMIDDGWSPYYGRWRFDREKFPDPAAMLAELHALGFAVMVWACPFITPDTQEYRELEQKGLLVKTSGGEAHIAHWWNGWSAALDLQNPGAADWLRAQFRQLEALGVDGFKLDAGDPVYYPENGDAQCAAWARFGAAWPLNEFRAAWRAGGLPLMQRLCDKHPTWDERGLAALTPCALTASLTGHPYVCPDMIGGGEYQSFLQQGAVDEELFVRWAEAACLMPVMQFSAAPWRVLGPKALAGVKAAAAVRAAWRDYLLETLDACAAKGEPMLRPLEYVFPGQGCGAINDQFMLGDRLLAAPLTKKGGGPRRVFLPRGVWQVGGATLQSPGGEHVVTEGECACGGLFLAWRKG